MNFEFATAGRIVFGPGTFGRVGTIAREFGCKAFVVTGRRGRFNAALQSRLSAAGVAGTEFALGTEPTVADVERGVAAAIAAAADCVIAVGGGSVMDAAKAISALVTNGGAVTDYLEVVGRAQPLSRPALPCIAIPTTAGTGAEVTRNAVLASPEHKVKVSLRSPLLLPRVAVIDPELTYELPPALTATTGLDALTQLIEPYVSSKANAMTDPLCREGLHRAARSLRVAVQDGANKPAREDMAVASLFGGLALANAGLGAVHGFAGPIGGAFPAPHGAVCAALLAATTAANVRALRARAPGGDALRRYDDVGRLLTGRPAAGADDAVHWLGQLVSELQIPRLAAYGMSPADIPALVAAAGRASSMKANSLPLTPDECAAVLEQAL